MSQNFFDTQYVGSSLNAPTKLCLHVRCVANQTFSDNGQEDYSVERSTFGGNQREVLPNLRLAPKFRVLGG